MTIASRTIRSSPHRSALETWNAIVDLLTRRASGNPRTRLLAVPGIASSVIADQFTRAAAIAATSVNTYTRSVTYVADNILKSLKDIIRLSGMDPAAFTEKWASYERALKAWLASKHLQKVVLEVFDPADDKLVLRWDVDISY